MLLLKKAAKTRVSSMLELNSDERETLLVRYATFMGSSNQAKRSYKILSYPILTILGFMAQNLG